MYTSCRCISKSCTCTCIIKYCIAGNFRGRKLLRKRARRFRRENFCGCILYRYRLCAHAMFAKKTFTNGLRSAKFAKVFSLESFLLYGYFLLIHLQVFYEILIGKCINHLYTYKRCISIGISRGGGLYVMYTPKTKGLRLYKSHRD